MFPDPWPKKRHAARRILQADMMDILAQLIRPNGQLVLASDDPTAKSMACLQTAYGACGNFAGQRGVRQIGVTARRSLPATRYMNKAEQAWPAVLPGLFSNAARDALRCSALDGLPACLHYQAKPGITLCIHYCRVLMVGRWPTFLLRVVVMRSAQKGA